MKRRREKVVWLKEKERKLEGMKRNIEKTNLVRRKRNGRIDDGVEEKERIGRRNEKKGRKEGENEDKGKKGDKDEDGKKKR